MNHNLPTHKTPAVQQWLLRQVQKLICVCRRELQSEGSTAAPTVVTSRLSTLYQRASGP